MNSAQIAFLNLIADRIPRLMAAIQQGNAHAEYVIGRRIVAGRQVRLVLLVEVVDPGGNPLATHSSVADAAASTVPEPESQTQSPAEPSPKSRRGIPGVK